MTISRPAHTFSADHMPGARLVSVGTATPPRAYTQNEILAWSNEKDPKIQRLFRNSHIERRHLYLPEPVDGQPPVESSQDLIDKHLRGVLEMGSAAVTAALEPLSLTPSDVDFLVCISSTGFLCPGISAHVIKHMGLRQDIQRLDIVGMGCNAAVNGLQATTALAQARPGAIGVMLCVEVCSAAYNNTSTMSSAVVNSLFGDGAAAVVVRAGGDSDWEQGPRVLDFQPFILTDAIRAMRYDLEDSRLSFFLDRDIPFVIGRHVSIPVKALLDRHGLQVADINHWLVHSGGKKVIDAIQANLELPEHHFRHTRDVLRAHGNMSSGSVLFSLKALQGERVVKPNDLGVLIAMGPGTSIETALLAW